MSASPTNSQAPANPRGPRTTPILLQRVCHRLGYAAKSDDGFTLVEALVAFSLLAIVSTASINAGITAVSSSNSSRDRITAANLAQQDLENARSLQYPDYPGADAAHPVTVGSKTFSLQRTVSATCPSLWTPGLPTSMVVTTTVTSPGAANRAVSVTMATVIAC
jgi:Tfp pilus assembly protein PilV